MTRHARFEQQFQEKYVFIQIMVPHIPRYLHGNRNYNTQPLTSSSYLRAQFGKPDLVDPLSRDVFARTLCALHRQFLTWLAGLHSACAGELHQKWQFASFSSPFSISGSVRSMTGVMGRTRRSSKNSKSSSPSRRSQGDFQCHDLCCDVHPGSGCQCRSYQPVPTRFWFRLPRSTRGPLA